MNDHLNHDDELLVAQAREALGRGPMPSAATFAAIHAEAGRQAEFRRGRAERWHRLWRRALAVGGGLAAAALLVFATRPASESPWPDREPADAVAAVETLSEDTLALMALVEGASIGLDGGAASDALLRLQESPGGFETAHALYASF